MGSVAHCEGSRALDVNKLGSLAKVCRGLAFTQAPPRIISFRDSMDKIFHDLWSVGALFKFAAIGILTCNFLLLAIAVLIAEA